MSQSRTTQLLEGNIGQSLRKVATGAAAIATTLAPASPFLFKGFRLHLSAVGGAGDLTITTDSSHGAAYDTVIFTQDMSSIADRSYILDTPIDFLATDELDFAWANGSTRTYGLEILYSLL